MYHIAVLTKSETQETFYREQLSRFCAEHGLFPRVDCYRGQEVFFEVARKNAPTNAVISLPGVDGLNAVEHLRALFPDLPPSASPWDDQEDATTEWAAHYMGRVERQV